MTKKHPILQEIKAFCAEQGIAPSTFGVRSVNNSRLVERLEDGGIISFAVEERVRAYLSAGRKRSKKRSRPFGRDAALA
jgi:hypothetical protein